MITLYELKRLAQKKYSVNTITLPQILLVWAQEDPEGHLNELLTGSGINNILMENAIKPLIDKVEIEDRNLLNKVASLSKGGDIYAMEILSKLCEIPHHRITRALIDKGMNCKIVQEKIKGERKPETVLSALGIKIDNLASPLLKFGRDLTSLSREGAFTELCNRPNEMNNLMNVLLRKRKGNPVLTGPAGVGKTALVELLAHEISMNKYSPLAGYSIYEISMGKLVAGTKYRGEFEARFEGVMKSIIDVSPAILFIDEIHLLLGSGRAEGAAMDASNLIKPFLARDSFRVIGATTSKEYQYYIARDEALARRFQEIKLIEPVGEILFSMVDKQTMVLSEHHRIEIGNEVIRKAIELTNRHVVNRNQPDKTIDLIDTACVSARRRGRGYLESNDLLDTLSVMTGTPISMLDGSEKDRLRNLAETLKERVIGQEEAIKKLTQSLIHRRMDIGNPERPLGVYLFAGDTGVGKSELARATAATFFGDESKIITIDLGEYSERTAVNKLIGVSYGYAGYEEEGVLIRGLQRHPSCVILLDEIEKANQEIHRLLLGLLDNGRIASGRGERYDARQCIIIMTTNAVTSKEMKQVAVGFSGKGDDGIDVYEHLNKTFPREFLGRIDEIIPFNSLSTSDIRAIIKMRADEAVKRLENKGVLVEYEEERLIEYLVGYLDAEQGGARAILRVLEKRLLHPLAIMLLESGNGKKIVVKLDAEFYETGELVSSNR